MATVAKMEVVLKINELPDDAHKVKNDWMAFTVSAEDQVIGMVVRPKTWAKLAQAQAEWPLWVASIAGRMGPRNPKGFSLLEPAIQTFERKPKPAADAVPE